jgi:hypothetical protein
MLKMVQNSIKVCSYGTRKGQQQPALLMRDSRNSFDLGKECFERMLP